MMPEPSLIPPPEYPHDWCRYSLCREHGDCILCETAREDAIDDQIYEAWRAEQ